MNRWGLKKNRKDDLKGFEKSLWGKPFRTQCGAGGMVTGRRGRGSEWPELGLGSRVRSAVQSTARGTAFSRLLTCDIWGACGIFSWFLNRPSNAGCVVWGRSGNWRFKPVTSTVPSNSATAEKFLSWEDFFFFPLNSSAHKKKNHLTVLYKLSSCFSS